MTTPLIDLTLEADQVIELNLEPTPSVNLLVSASIGDAGVQGEQGPPGPSGGNYVHTQNTPAFVWTIQHNLGYRPAGFGFYDEDGNPIGAIVTHLNDNVALATFLSEYAGVAYVS